jgi:hypothetical protein
MIHVETELVGGGRVRLQVERGVKLRLGVHLGGTGDGKGRARYLRRAKGTYWEGRRIRFYIFPHLFFARQIKYLIIWKRSPFRSNLDGGRPGTAV